MEAFSAIVAAASLLKYLVATSEKLKSLARAFDSAQSEASSLQAALRELFLCLDRFSEDVEGILKQKDRLVIKGYRDEARQIQRSCQEAFTHFRSIRPPVFKQIRELDAVRTEFVEAEARIDKLHTRFSRYIAVLGRVLPQSCPPSGRRESPPLSQNLKRRASEPAALIDSLEEISQISTGPILVRSRASSVDIDSDLVDAVEADDSSRITRFIEQCGDQDETEAFKSALLVCACQRRRPAVIRALLHGHNASYEGFGVVHHAVGRHQCWDDQAQNAIIEILELLIGLGVSVEKLALEEEDGHGRRVLHYCAMSNKYLVAKFILELNPALSLEMADITDRNGKTALFHISELPRPDEHLVKLLVSKNATFGKKRPPPAISHGQVLAREWCRLAISKRRGSTS